MTSGEYIRQLSNNDLEETKTETTKRGGAVKFLATTRRLMTFANNREPKPEDKIVYIDGAFDMLHPGHVDILQKAKEQGDFVVVGLYDDEVCCMLTL